jgi:hypothetical protein
LQTTGFDFLIEQIENGPIESGLIMPNIKQCMQLVNRAWYKVSDNSIINCWGKCRILSNFEVSEKLDLKDLIAKIEPVSEQILIMVMS